MAGEIGGTVKKDTMATTRGVMQAIAGAGASKAKPGPVDSFVFAGIVWYRLQTPGGNSVILGIPNASASKKRKATK